MITERGGFELVPSAEQLKERIFDQPTIAGQAAAFEQVVREFLPATKSVRVRETYSPELAQVFVHFKEAEFKKPITNYSGVASAVDDFLNRVRNPLKPAAFEKVAKLFYQSLRGYKKEYTIDERIEVPSEWMERVRDEVTEARELDDVDRLRSAFVRESIEMHKDEMRKEFKIHLNPKVGDSDRIKSKLLQLLASRPDLQRQLTDVKMTIRTSEAEDDGGYLKGVADIILYVDPAESVDATMDRCVAIIKILMTDFTQDEAVGRPFEEAPRMNFSFNRLIHLAQAGGDFKEYLTRLDDPTSCYRGSGGYMQAVEGRSLFETQLQGLFSEADRFAFFREDVESAHKRFDPLKQTASNQPEPL